MADFASWKHESLVLFAQEMQEQNLQLKDDLKIVKTAWRELLKEKYPVEAHAG